MVENDFRMLNGTLQVQFLRERGGGGRVRTKLNESFKRGASLGPRLRVTLTRRRFQLVPMKLPFYYCSICSARKLLSYSVEKLSRIIEARRRSCHDREARPLLRLQFARVTLLGVSFFFPFYSSIRFVTRVHKQRRRSFSRSHNFSAFKRVWEKILILIWRNSTRALAHLLDIHGDSLGRL